MKWAGHVARVGRGAERVLVGNPGVIRNLIPYEEAVGIDNKLNNYSKIADIKNDMFRAQKTLKKTIIKVYSTLFLPALLYSSEN